jgi:signal peptidase II
MLWLIISILIVAIDQISKYIVVQNIKPDQMIPVIDKFFYLTLHRNPGAAWGILQNSRLLFLIIIPVISVVVVYYLFKSSHWLLKLALAMILGGAIGNYIDRLFIGKVTDFLLFYIGSYPFPIFNAADMAVTGGTILLAIYMLFVYKEPQKKGKAGEADAEQADKEEAADAGARQADRADQAGQTNEAGRAEEAEQAGILPDQQIPDNQVK